MNGTTFRILLLAAVSGLLFGCSHPLEIHNLRSYRNVEMQPLDQSLSIGITPSSMSVDEMRLTKGVGSALGRHAAKVTLPYNPASEKQVDVIAQVGIKSHYSGSGLNFLINFPGFLIWAPAWNGYVYEARYDIDIALTRAADRVPIDRWTTPVILDIRHSDISRTWTEISWFEVGAIALIGGVVFTQYDSDVTPLLVDAIETPIGDYLAQEIVLRLNNSGMFAPQPAPVQTAPQPASARF